MCTQGRPPQLRAGTRSAVRESRRPGRGHRAQAGVANAPGPSGSAGAKGPRDAAEQPPHPCAQTPARQPVRGAARLWAHRAQAVPGAESCGPGSDHPWGKAPWARTRRPRALGGAEAGLPARPVPVHVSRPRGFVLPGGGPAGPRDHASGPAAAPGAKGAAARALLRVCGQECFWPRPVGGTTTSPRKGPSVLSARRSEQGTRKPAQPRPHPGLPRGAALVGYRCPPHGPSLTPEPGPPAAEGEGSASRECWGRPWGQPRGRCGPAPVRLPLPRSPGAQEPREGGSLWTELPGSR